ncbi:hypothetical protein [Panacagrimonas sp.]|uniref:hypothetical protein n=1 Tax=Panacagrimonas sp. TaxID=2480088 RepID=UPI003B51E8F7
MNNDVALAVLRAYNGWRVDDPAYPDMPDPVEITQALDLAIAALAAPPPAQSGDDELHGIGYREGYDEAVQDIDLLTGGDGEYRYCTDHDPDRHTPDAETMKARIEQRFDELQPAQSGEVEAWKFVDTDGQPDPGLYVAIYKGHSSLHVALCSYGDWEFNDIDDQDDRADDEGVVRGFGWTEEAEDRGGDGYVHERDVVAYLPTDYQCSDKTIAAVRALLARREDGE